MPLQRAEVVRLSNYPGAPDSRTLKRHKCRAPTPVRALVSKRLADSFNRTRTDVSVFGFDIGFWQDEGEMLSHHSNSP